MARIVLTEADAGVPLMSVKILALLGLLWSLPAMAQSGPIDRNYEASGPNHLN